MPVKCPQCGSICRDNARFCDTCGSGLSVVSEGAEPHPAPHANHRQEPQRPISHPGFLSGLWKIPLAIVFWVIAAGTTLFAGLGLGLYFFEFREEDGMYGAAFFLITLAVVFLLTRVSHRTWFRYFGVYFVIMVVGSTINPEMAKNTEQYPFIVAAIGMVVGLFFLKGGKFRGIKTHWGRVTDVQPRYQTSVKGSNSPIEVLGFRLQETAQDFQEMYRDSQQNPLPPLAVEIRAREISGAPQNGDKVEVEGSIVSGIVYAKRIINHSTRSEVVMKDPAGIP
jgi:hypothetical protein